MRLAILIGFKHGCATPVVIAGPDVPIADQRASMREARLLPSHEQFQRIELWTSSQGRIARKRLGQPIEETPAGSEQEDPANGASEPAESDSQGASDEAEADLAAKSAGAKPSPAKAEKPPKRRNR